MFPRAARTVAWVTDPSKFLVRVCATWPHLSSALISRFYSKYRSSRAAADHVANTRTARGCNHVQLYSQKQCLHHPFSMAEYHSKTLSPFHFFAYTLTANFIDVRYIIMSMAIQKINKNVTAEFEYFWQYLIRHFTSSFRQRRKIMYNYFLLTPVVDSIPHK